MWIWYKIASFVGWPSTATIQDIMAPIQDPTGLDNLLFDKIAAVNCSAVSASTANFPLAILRTQTPYPPDFVLEDLPRSMTPALLNVLFQPPQTFFTETPMGTLLAQVPYDAPQGMPQDPYLQFQDSPDPWAVRPQTAIGPFENSVRVESSILSQSHRIKNFWFHRSPHSNGTMSAGWVHCLLASRSRIWSSLPSPRCVFSVCVLDEFLIS